MHQITDITKPICLVGSAKNIYEFFFMFESVHFDSYFTREDDVYDIPLNRLLESEFVDILQQRNFFLIVCDVKHEMWESWFITYEITYGKDYLNFEDYFESLNRFHYELVTNRPVAIWGIGETQKNTQKEVEKNYPEISVTCYIDGNDAGQTKEMNGHPVYHVSDIPDIKNYFIIVASVYYSEIKQRLLGLGMEEEKDFMPFSVFFTNPCQMMQTLVTSMPVREYYCNRPYRWFYYAWFGAYSCCSTWVKYPIGNPMVDSPEECWNSIVAKLFRLSVENRTYCFCIPYACEIWHSKINDARIVNYTVPSMITLGLDYSCNLHCSTCRDKVIVAEGRQLQLREQMADQMKKTGWLDKTEKLELSGTGEALASKIDRRIIESGRNRHSISLLTNGILLTRSMCEQLIHRYTDIELHISIDAATEETYKKIRRGGNWQRLMNNLNTVSQFRKEGKIRYFEIRMVVQRDNYSELIDFVKMGKSLSVDKVYLTKLLNWGMYSESEYYSKAMIDDKGNLDCALLEIFHSPELNDPVVQKTQFLRYL